MPSISALHTQTPVLNVIEPRGLHARSVSFHRTHVDESPSERIDHSTYDAAGRRVSRWDPRLWAAAKKLPDTPSNVSTLSSLSGQVLFTESVDAGWSAELLGEGGYRVCRWDGAGHSQRVEYDQLLRSVAVFENDGARESCTERLSYGGPDAWDANQCGQLIRHDDPSGSVIGSAFSLTGQVIQQTRRFLNELAGPDWPELESDRDSFLEPSAGATICWRFDAAGEAAEQTDAMGNTQRFGQTVSGQLKSTRLQLLNQPLQTLVSDIHYDAHNRIEAETLGNGIVTTLDYDPSDGRLRNLRADNGRLQDLHYAYDPVGNVVSIEDCAQPTRYFANQQIEPLRTFMYNTLYQLIEATGYESATVNKGPTTQSFATANELSNYIQRYEYDAGGNLQTLIHTGARNRTRAFATARYSNRSLLQTGVNPPTEEQIAAGFDANGNLREVSPGQTLSWDVRNQLSGVTPVERENGVNDRETYQYDAAGARVRKVRITQSRALVHLSEVRYLPGLEIRSNAATGEVLHVITATVGRSYVRVLHWQTGRPTDIENNQARYSLTDHLGSSTLELDNHGQLISHEAYFPFGETAWFAARSELAAKYKTVRYSGKERDATGLYDYGLRYYAPWLMRWLNPDPAGEKGGLNLFMFVLNRPLCLMDRQGLEPVRIATGISAFPDRSQQKMREVLELSKNIIELLTTKDVSDEARNARQAALATSFGEVRSPGFDEAVGKKLNKLREFLISLEGDHEARLVLAELPQGVRGETSDAKAGGDRTVFLSSRLLKEGHPLDVAKTLIHEASHAVHNTRDFAYVGLGINTPQSNPKSVAQYVQTLKDSSHRLLSTGPDESQMQTWDVFHYAKLMTRYGAPPRDSAARQQLFLNDPNVRGNVLLNNADSLATYSVIAWHNMRQQMGHARASGSGASFVRRLKSLFK
ncbi:RHS repeat domain-containing protein [Pseudomonas sp. UBA1879]|uniref:RHS repeat domain-containing protein n=1 Tax=Pseudomonas sp. UBA1879 TaxID=1947305 RepID=UPI0025D4628D|nr:RHS repeat-associated core domain-containing protein [Pseudomonas sp. UBA1879]